MNKLKNVWVISDRAGMYSELCSGAAELGESVTLVYAGARGSAVGADRAYWLGETGGVRWPAFLPTVAALVKENAPELVLLCATKNGRLTAGYLAAALGASPVSDAFSVKVDDGIVCKRLVYGGAAVETLKPLGATAVVVVSNGTFEAVRNDPASEITDAALLPCAGLECTGVSAGEAASVNLSAAKRIVGVGRGLSDENDLAEARELAAVLGGELGCTRPVAEELKWLPRESYIGISGVTVKPDIYVAVGISGQVQHTVGIGDSGVIVAVNKDTNAPIFKDCDYGIVGDLKKIVPELTNLIKKGRES